MARDERKKNDRKPVEQKGRRGQKSAKTASSRRSNEESRQAEASSPHGLRRKSIRTPDESSLEQE